MRVTINLFKESLKNIERHFATLSEGKVVYDNNGVAPMVSRTKMFAEAKIVLNNEIYLLCMPLSAEAHTQAIFTSAYIGGLFSPVITHYRLLHEEMSVADAAGGIRKVDILLHRVPDGQNLHSFIDFADPTKLHTAVDRLEKEFLRLGIVHNNLTPHNIIVSEDYCLTPIRYYYAERATAEHNCHEEFNKLREWINTIYNVEMEYGEEMLPKSLFEEYDYVSTPFEGVVSVRNKSGYLYVNCKNEVVIDGHFKWASDFREGRAEVETDQGMGLIDKQGRYIIPAEYKDLEYDAQSGLSRVKRGEAWGVFNYVGEQILPFENRYIDDEDLLLLNI